MTFLKRFSLHERGRKIPGMWSLGEKARCVGRMEKRILMAMDVRINHYGHVSHRGENTQ